jgi:hypothetical protein
LSFARYKHALLFQRLGENDAQLAGQMIVAGASPPECFRRRRTGADAARRNGKGRQALQCYSDLRAISGQVVAKIGIVVGQVQIAMGFAALTLTLCADC